MLLRFQGQKPNEGTASKLGIFQLAIELRDRTDLPQYAFDELQSNLDWFNENLISPNYPDNRSIAWFKSEAHEPLERIWAIKAVLEDFGYPIDLVKSETPGYVIYEDEWQIIAKPFRRSPYVWRPRKTPS